MPNWCNNVLFIRGADQRELAQVWREDRPFQQLVPMPSTWTKEEIEALNNTFRLQGMGVTTEEDAWYWWRLDHWGTKWDLNRDEITVVELEGDNGVETRLRFDTAWSPPIPVIKAASALYPKLTLELVYVEPSMEFAGEATFVGGGVREDNYYEGGREYRRIAADFGWTFELDEEEDDEAPNWQVEGF